ncbi:MAG: hypothetical protein SGARI_002330, partial [Bacillariaceae sp.]
RLQSDPGACSSGIIVDTNGWIRDEGYELLKYTADALKISIILVLGHDRLYSMLNSHYKKMPETSIKIVKLPRSGGVVSPPKDFSRLCRSRSIKKYFYGDAVEAAEKSGEENDASKTNTVATTNQLTPFLVQLPLSDVKIYKVSSMALSSSLLPVAQQQSTDAIQLEELDLEDSNSSKSNLELLQHALLSVCHPAAVAKYEEEGNSARSLVTAGVAGFCVVERIVEETSTIHLLSPCAGALPSHSLIVGDGITWME